MNARSRDQNEANIVSGAVSRLDVEGKPNPD